MLRQMLKACIPPRRIHRALPYSPGVHPLAFGVLCMHRKQHLYIYFLKALFLVHSGCFWSGWKNKVTQHALSEWMLFNILYSALLLSSRFYSCNPESQITICLCKQCVQHLSWFVAREVETDTVCSWGLRMRTVSPKKKQKKTPTLNGE